MRSKILLTFGALGISPFCWSALDHGASTNLIHQHQNYDISGETLRLPVKVPSFTYNLSGGPWAINASISEGEASDSELESGAPLRYSLKYEQKGKSLFIDYNFDDAWLSTGYSIMKQYQAYWASANGIRTLSDNKLDIESIVIESGFGWYFDASQILASLGLTYQTINDQYQLSQTLTGDLNINEINSDEIKETALLGDFNLRYQYYLPASDSSHWLLGAGYRYSKSVNGSAQISQTTRVRLAGTNVLSEDDKLFVESDSESSSLQIQTGLILDYGSLDILVDKLVDDSWSNAFIEAGITLYF